MKKVTEQGRSEIKQGRVRCKVQETTDHIPTLSNSCDNVGTSAREVAREITVI